MANQKEIRVKISSTKKTMKITSAMKLVAAAKVNKMQKILTQARPYADKLSQIFTNLQVSLSEDDIATNPLLSARPEIKTVALLVIGSDRGLCGGYNANLIKAVNRKIEAYSSENKTVKLIVVGRKLKTAFSKLQYKDAGIEVLESFINLSSIPTSSEAALIANTAADLFVNGQVDKVEIISTRFISMVSNEVKFADFLPVEASSSQTAESAEAILEPSAAALIETLAPMYVENKVYQSLLEATTSELASRMTAMSNATNNARDFIKKLVIAYNKARQASITQEISEIVGGAAALA
jgi:F-type H+-transporting ATPase subunit gamma